MAFVARRRPPIVVGRRWRETGERPDDRLLAAFTGAMAEFTEHLARLMQAQNQFTPVVGQGHQLHKPLPLIKRVAALPAPPANLRDPAILKSQNDEDRFRSIKRGHPDTAMYPKTLLRDEDIRDLVAYLSTLRNQKP